MSLLTSLISPIQTPTDAHIAAIAEARVGGEDPTPYPITPVSGGSIAAWPGGNQGIFVKFRLGRGRHAVGLRVPVGTPSGNAKVALYASDGTTATQIALSASTALTATNDFQEIPFAAAVDLVTFTDYYGFLAVDNATATFYRLTFGAGGIAADLGYAVITNVFTTPPATQTVSGLTTGAASGYTPVLALY